jgi:hypothetical protein
MKKINTAKAVNPNEDARPQASKKDAPWQLNTRNNKDDPPTLVAHATFTVER